MYWQSYQLTLWVIYQVRIYKLLYCVAPGTAVHILHIHIHIHINTLYIRSLKGRNFSYGGCIQWYCKWAVSRAQNGGRRILRGKNRSSCFSEINIKIKNVAVSPSEKWWSVIPEIYDWLDTDIMRRLHSAPVIRNFGKDLWQILPRRCQLQDWNMSISYWQSWSYILSFFHARTCLSGTKKGEIISRR